MSSTKQKPVTYNMTEEQRNEYFKMVHEEQRGNVGNPWAQMPYADCGTSRKVEDKPMSDNLMYNSFDYENDKCARADRTILAERKNAHKQIEKYRGYIAGFEARIKQIQADNTMETIKKQQKIQNCIAKIDMYKKDIERAKAFLAIQAEKTQAMFGTDIKTK